MILCKTAPNLEFSKSYYQMQNLLDTKSQSFQRYMQFVKNAQVYMSMIAAQKQQKLEEHLSYASIKPLIMLHYVMENYFDLSVYLMVKCYILLYVTKTIFLLLLNRVDFITPCNHWKNYQYLKHLMYTRVCMMGTYGKVLVLQKEMKMLFSHIHIHLILD